MAKDVNGLKLKAGDFVERLDKLTAGVHSVVSVHGEGVRIFNRIHGHVMVHGSAVRKINIPEHAPHKLKYPGY